MISEGRIRFDFLVNAVSSESIQLLDLIQCVFIATILIPRNSKPMNRPFTLYYAATILFVLLDYVLGINLRVAFLEAYPAARLVYYAICFACLALILWQPRWATLIGGIESLVALIVMTISMMLRVVIVTDEMIEQGSGFVRFEEIVNYLMVGSIAYLSWIRGIQSLKSTKIAKNDDT